METWKPIDGTNGKIFVSDAGRVCSYLRGSMRILKAQQDKKGYLRVSFTIEREKKTIKVHREVAKAFIPNPEGLPQVNHKDGNKLNNDIANLEWTTNRDNARHAIASGLWDSVIEGAKKANELQRKPIIGYKDGKEYRFPSICSAQAFVGSKHISAVLHGKRPHTKGWTFSYEGGEACANA